MSECENLPYFFAVISDGSYKIYRCTTHVIFKMIVNIVNLENHTDSGIIRKISRYNKTEKIPHISFVRKWNEGIYSSCEWFYTNKIVDKGNGEYFIPVLKFENCRKDLLPN